MAFSDILDGESGSSVRTKLNTLKAVEAGATADQTDAEIEIAYNTQVIIVSQSEAEAGTSTTARRWTAQRVSQAIAAIGFSSLVEDLSPQLGGVLDTNAQAIDESEGSSVASGATTDIWAVDGNTIHITGSTGPATSLGTAARAGAWRKCIFDSTPTWNDGANLILPNSANFTFAADDIAYVYADTTTQFRVVIFKGDGTAVVGALQTPWTADIDQAGFSITDGGGLEVLSFVETASAINEVTIANNSIGLGPTISATGDDTDIALNLAGKGTQGVAIGGVTPVAGTELLLPNAGGDVFATPTLAFGDGDTGFYENVDDQLFLSMGGLKSFFFFTSRFQCARAGLGTASIQCATPSATVPVFTTTNTGATGLGGTANTLSLITDNVEAINIDALQGVTFKPGVGVTAFSMTLNATPGDAIIITDSAAIERFIVEADGGIIIQTGSSANDFVSFAGTTTQLCEFNSDGLGSSLQILGDNSGSGGPAEIRLGSTGVVQFNSVADLQAGSRDTEIGRTSAGSLSIGSLTVVGAEIGTSGIGLANVTEGGTARLTRKTTHENHTLAAASTSDTTTISIPSGARLLAVSFNVNTAVVDDAGDDTWSAAFITGSTTTLATAAAAAQNTKIDKMLPDEISTGVCQIRFTANAGNFSAGVIEIVAYYEELTSLANV